MCVYTYVCVYIHIHIKICIVFWALDRLNKPIKKIGLFVRVT